MKAKPTIVCLCGSPRFKEAFAHIRAKLTLRGNIVVGPEVFVSNPLEYAALKMSEDWGRDDELDTLQLRKIDLADAVFVVNPGNYIGEGTRKEIEYAEKSGKPVFYHEKWYEPEYAGDESFWQETNYPLPEGIVGI